MRTYFLDAATKTATKKKISTMTVVTGVKPIPS